MYIYVSLLSNRYDMGYCWGEVSRYKWMIGIDPNHHNTTLKPLNQGLKSIETQQLSFLANAEAPSPGTRSREGQMRHRLPLPRCCVLPLPVPPEYSDDFSLLSWCLAARSGMESCGGFHIQCLERDIFWQIKRMPSETAPTCRLHVAYILCGWHVGDM